MLFDRTTLITTNLVYFLMILPKIPGIILKEIKLTTNTQHSDLSSDFNKSLLDVQSQQVSLSGQQVKS